MWFKREHRYLPVPPTEDIPVASIRRKVVALRKAMECDHKFEVARLQSILQKAAMPVPETMTECDTMLHSLDRRPR